MEKCTVALLLCLLFVGTPVARAAEACPEFPPKIRPAPPQNPEALAWSATIAKHAPDTTDILLVGNSLIYNWPPSAFADTSPAPQIFNYGVFKDKTQNTLWRLQSKTLNNLKIKKAVILIGTNNLTDNDPPCVISSGIEQIALDVQRHWPSAKIAIIGLLPRGKNWSEFAQSRQQINSMLKDFSRQRGFDYFDISDDISCHYTQPCNNYRDDLMHINDGGYKILTEKLKPWLAGE